MKKFIDFDDYHSGKNTGAKITPWEGIGNNTYERTLKLASGEELTQRWCSKYMITIRDGGIVDKRKRKNYSGTTRPTLEFIREYELKELDKYQYEQLM